MNEIVLSPEQALILASAKGSVPILRPNGELIGWAEPLALAPSQSPFTIDEVKAAEEKAADAGAWHSTQEVLERLRSLDRSQS